MRRLLPVLVVGLACAFPAAAVGQVPRQDSVSLSGVARGANFTVTTLNATSGPNGENPSGQVTFTVFGTVSVGGPVTCLAVHGNTATIVIQDQGIFGQVKIQVTDKPDTFDALPDGGDCSVPLPPTGGGGPVSGGDITVVDAPPLPTSKDQCTNGGWRSFPGFKNEGDCVSFVATGGKNPPGNSTP